MEMEHEAIGLEMSPEAIRALGARVVELIARKQMELPEASASDTSMEEGLLEALLAPPPEAPGDLDELLALTMRAAGAAYETAGPSYLAYIPGGGIFSAAAAEFLAAGLNRYTGRVGPAPALVAQEQSVLRWLCDLFSMPAGSQALLTTGGSSSNTIAQAVARTKLAEGRVDRATVYVGEHGHGSLVKAARMVGIQSDHVRKVRSDAELRMDVDHLRESIAADRRRGLVPVCVTASAGTTNTGAIDPLERVAEVARDAGLWFHVDAAYGGFFQLTRRGAERLRGIESADSITLDPHKTLFLPFGTGALIVRSADDLRRAFAAPAEYMQDIPDVDDLPDFDALSPELTRDYRGLRLWLPLHLHGVAAFRRQLDEKLDLARFAYDALRDDGRFEVPWEPDLSVIAFRLAGADDDVQRTLLDEINATQRVLLSSTMLGGRYFIRIAIVSVRTHADRVRECLEIIRRAVEKIIG